MDTDSPSRLVTIDYFVKDMLGMSNRAFFYDHAGDPGFPQRVKIGSRAFLVRSECEQYVADRIEARDKPKAKPPEKVKRHIGRPAAQRT